MDGCAHERSPDRMRASTPACRTSRKAARSPTERRYSRAVAPGTAIETSATVRGIRSVERCESAVRAPRVADSRPGARDTYHSAPLVESRTGVSHRTPTCPSDLGGRRSQLLLVFAAIAPMVQPRPAATHPAPGWRRPIGRACPSPSTPRTRAPTSLRGASRSGHEPCRAPPPPAGWQPELPRRRDESRNSERPVSRLVSANQPKARAAEATADPVGPDGRPHETRCVSHRVSTVARACGTSRTRCSMACPCPSNRL